MRKICILFITLAFMVGCSAKEEVKKDLSYQKLLTNHKTDYINALTPEDPLTYYITATTKLKKINSISPKKVDKTLKTIINDYNKTISLDPTFSPAYYGLGIAYLKLNDTKKAEEALVTAARLNPVFIDYQLGAGIVCEQNQHYECAINKYLQIMQMDPENSDAYIYMANILLQKGDYNRAEKLFKTVLRYDENNELAKAALEEIKHKSLNSNDTNNYSDNNSDESQLDDDSEDDNQNLQEESEDTQKKRSKKKRYKKHKNK